MLVAKHTSSLMQPDPLSMFTNWRKASLASTTVYLTTMLGRVWYFTGTQIDLISFNISG